MITLNDYFCGAGGSSTGALDVPDVEVQSAANHWPLAIETHAANHPHTRHVLCDLSSFSPRRIPRSDIGWFSPECTNHSHAKGQKKPDQCGPDLFGETLTDDAAERSRATMWDVPRFTEAHRYEVVIVENVIEVTSWQPYRAWLQAMDCLGYDHQVVSLNSMHAQAHGLPAPQSRDRVYVVFWRKGNRRPDLAGMQRPQAWCPTCDGVVASVQAWKPGRSVGRYRAQYVYQCPTCRTTVEPAWLPAASIIDWTLTGQRIGDRKRPLSNKTRARIEAGIRRYWTPLIVEAAGHTYDAADPKHLHYGDPDGYYRAWPTTDALGTIHTTQSKALVIPVEGRDRKAATTASGPLRTMTARNETGLALPAFLAELRGTSSTRPASDPLSTVTAGGFHHALVASYYGNGDTRTVADTLGTVTTHDRHALIMRNNTGGAEMVTPAREPIRTLTTAGHQSVLQGPAVDVDDVHFRMLEPSESKRAMAFPASYEMRGTRREQQVLAGNAVTPPSARDLIWAAAESLGAVA